MKKIILILLLTLMSVYLFSAVEFMGLSADFQNMNVILSWSTATETENMGFILERKIDPWAEWESLASYVDHEELQGQGTVSYQTDYVFTDTSVISGTYYYRISGIDYSNRVGLLDSLNIYVEETAIAELIPDDHLLFAYPNPFNPETHIHFNLPIAAPVEMNIYSMNGVLIDNLINNIHESGEFEITWKANDIPSGIYILIVKLPDGIHTCKLVLLK